MLHAVMISAFAPAPFDKMFLVLQMVASALMAHSIQAPFLASSSSKSTTCSTSAPLILQKASFKVTPLLAYSSAIKAESMLMKVLFHVLCFWRSCTLGLKDTHQASHAGASACAEHAEHVSMVARAHRHIL